MNWPEENWKFEGNKTTITQCLFNTNTPTIYHKVVVLFLAVEVVLAVAVTIHAFIL